MIIYFAGYCFIDGVGQRTTCGMECGEYTAELVRLSLSQSYGPDQIV